MVNAKRCFSGIIQLEVAHICYDIVRHQYDVSMSTKHTVNPYLQVAYTM